MMFVFGLKKKEKKELEFITTKKKVLKERGKLSRTHAQQAGKCKRSSTARKRMQRDQRRKLQQTESSRGRHG